MSGLTDRLTTAATRDTSLRDGDGAQPALLRATATVFAAVAVASAVVGAALFLLAGQTPSLPEIYAKGAAGAAYAVAGGLVLWNRPRNLLGWLVLSGALPTLWFAADAIEVFAAAQGTSVGIPHFVKSVGASQNPSILIPLLFPTGVLLSARWRPVLIAGVIGVVANQLANGNALPEPMMNGAYVVGFLGVLAGYVIGGSSVVIRYRRAASEERHQIKWLAFAFLVGIALLPLMAVFDGAPDRAGEAAHAVLVPGAIAVAVLRYRLYDIDVVISKTVVFAGLAAFITAIYVGIVVGLGSLLGAGGEPNLALSIVATAVVAVAFQPVRERLTRLANRLVFGRRATPYEVLSRFSEHLGEVTAPEQTLQRMARLLADGTGAAWAQVWLRVGGQLEPVATWPVHMTDDAQPDHRVEVIHEGQLLGALSVDKQRGESLTPTDQKLVDDLAAQAGLVLRNLKLTEELKAKIVDLQASRQRLVAAQDAERRRLERDLHDGAQRQLLALKSRLATASSIAAGEQATKATQILQQVTVDADDAVATLRELAHGIYPPLLAAEGLAGALTAQAAKAAVPVVVEGDGVGRYPQDVEAAVYFCVLEAVQNAAKYANPTHVTVRLTEHDGHLTFEVTDDGAGFDPATIVKGHGTTNMTDRLDALDGALQITSSLDNGTRITGRVPTSRPDEVAVREIHGSAVGA